MKNKVGLIINDNLLSTIFFKKIINDDLIDLEFVIIEKMKKKKNYIFLFLLFNDLFHILKRFFISIIKNENIKSLCKQNKIKLLISQTLNENFILNAVNKSKVKNVFFVNIYNKLNIQNYSNEINFINIHLGDTNKYRGVFCLIHSIINNEEFFYITSHFIVKEFDKGDIIYQKKIKLYKESIFFIYMGLFIEKCNVIYKTLNLLKEPNFKRNSNIYKIYKPPSFNQVYKFFRSISKYPSR